MRHKKTLLLNSGKLDTGVFCYGQKAYSVVTNLASIEWFHSVLNSETFYLHKWRNITEDSLTDIVKNYIIFYNETRVQQKLNDQSPVEYRKLVT